MFPNNEQIEDIKNRLRDFARRVVKSVYKKTDQLFYAYEPERKTIHIISGEETFVKVLGIMAEQKRKFKRFPNGKVFRLIPRRIVEFGLLINPVEYNNTECWGTQKKLDFKAFFNGGRLYFRLGNSTSSVTEEPTEIDIPNIKEGERFRKREDQISMVFSDISIESMLDSLGIRIDPELRKTIKYKLKEVGRTLTPDSKAISAI